MKRRGWIVAAIVIAVAGIGYSIYWWIVAGLLDKGIDAWAASQRQAGLTVEFERTPVTGFPFAFRANFHHPHIAGVLGGQAFDWHGPDVEASVSPLDLHSLILKAPGHHRLDLSPGPAVLDAGELVARWGSNSQGASVSATFADAQLTMPDGRSFAAGSGTASLHVPPTPPQSDKDPLLQFAARLVDLRLPEGTSLLTADPLGEAQLAGTVKGAMPVAPLRQALTAWRDAGGTVDLSSFALVQAPLSLSGSATIALDNDLQPIVAADLKARGLGPTIDLLASQKRIYPEDALKMKLFVKGAERDATGGYKEVATGLTLQGGYLSWGPFKLAKVPPIQWPQ
jgi:hypothetical protein